MNAILQKLESAGLAIPEILLPSPRIDLQKWPALACDQFTQDKNYWEHAERSINGAPSALNMILPEAYLEEGGLAERIERIHGTMNRYLERPENGGVFSWPRNAGVYVERETRRGTRKGIIAAIDLEKYSWEAGAKTLIRASEGVIEERLPPRIEIRRQAPLELPHIILLIDDEDDLLFSMLSKVVRSAPYIYDCGLGEGGRVKGRLISRKTDWNFIADYFSHAHRQACTDYGAEDAFLFAVGDGNHSLAAAKAVWEEYKQENKRWQPVQIHPARWALVEIENIYDSALTFEPIHRLLLNTGLPLIAGKLASLPGFCSREIASRQELAALTGEANAPGNRYGLVSKDKNLLVETACRNVSTVALEPLLDAALKEASGQARPAKIDYIHDTQALFDAVDKNQAQNAAGILLPPFNRKILFKTIFESGPLPRKSFSMGEALEKRFYFEGRRLFE